VEEVCGGAAEDVVAVGSSGSSAAVADCVGSVQAEQNSSSKQLMGGSPSLQHPYDTDGGERLAPLPSGTIVRWPPFGWRYQDPSFFSQPLLWNFSEPPYRIVNSLTGKVRSG